MGKGITFLIFFFCGSISLPAQDFTLLRKAKQLYVEANTLFGSDNSTSQTDQSAYFKYQQALELYRLCGIIDDTLADIYMNIGIYHLSRKDFQAAYESYIKSVELYKKQHSQNDSVFFKPYILIGQTSFELNNYSQAEEYFNKAKGIFSKEIRSHYTEYIVTFYNLGGSLYYQLGNYRQSINYFTKSIEDSKRNNIENDQYYIVVNSINVATANTKIGKYDEALKVYHALLNYNLFIDEINYNIGYTYLQLQDYHKALTYFKKDKASTPIHKIKLLNNLANTYLHLNSLKEAVFNYNQSIQLNQQHHVLNPTELSRSHLGKGRVYEAQSNYRQALEQYQTAIHYLQASFPTADPYQNPTDFIQSISKLDLFEVLNAKAHALQLLFNQTRRLPDLKASLQTYQLSIQLGDQIRKSYDSDDAKLFFNKTVCPVYEEALGVAFQLFEQTKNPAYLATAFAFSEGSKAAVLAESLRELEIKQIPGVNPELLRQERSLKRNITALNLRLMSAADGTEKATLQARIRDEEIALAQLVKEFEKNPQYYRLKYDTRAVSIAQLQQKSLDKRTALLEYFVGKNQLYAFVITSEGFEAKQWPLPASFRQDLARLQHALYTPQSGTRYAGEGPAFRLYQHLFAPLSELLKRKERLIVIPDAELSYLPFEALVTEPTGNHYLLHDFTMSYAYSGTLLDYALEKEGTQTDHSLLAMAPFAEKLPAGNPLLLAVARSETLAPLYASRKEVEQIGGQQYMAAEATKERFLRAAESYRIIHLATHAKANNADPLRSYIAFYPQDKDSLAGYRLYAQELYNMRLKNARLVVLSACETGSGQLIRGEGIMSLARAFAYAGCPSIITTLWKADDQATAEITSRMHQYLQAGKGSDEALRLAKLDYLDHQSDPRRKAPSYWANFVFIGDPAPLYSPDYTTAWVVAGLLILALLVGWGWRKQVVLNLIVASKMRSRNPYEKLVDDPPLR